MIIDINDSFKDSGFLHNAIASISEIMNKLNEPLTDSQKVIMAGALAVWLDKAYELGKIDSNANPLDF